MPRIAAVGGPSDPTLITSESKESGTGVIGESRVPFHKAVRGGRGGLRGGRGGRGGGRGSSRGGKREDPLKGGNFNFGVK